ncbi:MAG: bacteriohemerythrin [Negativicutes bacterium]|nr:bacteriohemerythrin [Negativicutes bacterium]
MHLVLDHSLATGIAKLDSQHQFLVDAINSLYDEGMNCPDIEAEKKLTIKFLAEFSRYADIHFAFEEELLLQHGFPACEKHKQEHAEFLHKLNELRQSHQQDMLSYELFSFVLDWFRNHLNESDMAYIKYFRHKGIL